jgi:hypothetical protein
MAGACASGSTATDSTTSNPPPVTPTTDGSIEPDAPGTGSATTSTTVIPAEVTVLPLTGLPDEGVGPRPALVVKVDNHDRARPQFGLSDADVVYEEIVEGGLTRFAAVFHSRDADPVGPVRSVRTSDFPLLQNLGRPLFGNSGGNDGVLALLADVDMVDVSSNAAGDAYYRFDERQAPHNLLTDTAALRAAGEERGAGGAPPALFAYRDEGEPLPVDAAVVQGVEIEYGTTEVTYAWDGEGWQRSQNGTPHVDAEERHIAPDNLVVQFVSYGRSAADGRSPEAVLEGEGAAWVFTDGQLITGTWQRSERAAATEFLDDRGSVIELTPGTTWVALPRVGQVIVLG